MPRITEIADACGCGGAIVVAVEDVAYSFAVRDYITLEVPCAAKECSCSRELTRACVLAIEIAL
jgi:hypothetical protein